MTDSTGIVLIGLGNIGSSVLEQLVFGQGFSRVVVADSKHLISLDGTDASGFVEPQMLKQILDAKRSGSSLKTLSDRLPVENVRELPRYFKSGNIVVNAMPTEFYPGASLDEIPSLRNDAIALGQGSDVITAHKSAFASMELYLQMAGLASKGMVSYVPAGAVMGPTRAAEVIMWLMANEIGILSARGVVNGTTGHILTEMFKGRDYGEVKAEAVKLGIAEPDPTSDVRGYDALSKMRSIGMMAGTYRESQLLGINDQRSKLPSDLRSLVSNNGHLGIEGITSSLVNELKARGLLIKLVGTYDGETGIAQVGPQVLSGSDMLVSVNGRENIIVLELSRDLGQSGTPGLSEMITQLYVRGEAGTGFPGYFYVPIDFPIAPISRRDDGISQGRQSYKICFMYDPLSRQLLITGPGEGSTQTAAALLGAVERIRNPSVNDKLPSYAFAKNKQAPSPL